MRQVKGAMSAIITPFKNGKLDEVCYEKLINRQLDAGMDAVVPVGTTGESATLSTAEHMTCIEIAVDVCKTRAKVLAGTGSNCTSDAIELTRFAIKAGATSVLSVVPYYNKPTQEGLYQHFAQIARAAGDSGVLLYNVPARSAAALSEDTILRLFKDFDNIYGVKEASSDVAACISMLQRAHNLCIMSGDDALNYPILALGGEGVISVTGNLLPHMIVKMMTLCKEQDFIAASKLARELVDINKVLFCESNPIPIKAAMSIAGLCELEYRLPLCPPSKENMAKIEEVLKNYEIKG